MGWLTPLLDILFPPRCLFCRTRVAGNDSGCHLCGECEKNLLDPGSCCPWCGSPYGDGAGICPGCRGRYFAFSAACAVGLYRGALKQIIHNYKYRGQYFLAEPLGKLIVRQIYLSGWPEFSLVVPLPLYPGRLAERGFDQALLLAQVVGKGLNKPVKELLKRVKPTSTQTLLGEKERWHNVKDAFAFRHGENLAGTVLLIDDLLTTGATAHYAAEALLAAGAREVYLAVVGRS